MASNSFDVKFKCQGLRLVIEISSIIHGKLVEEPCVGYPVRKTFLSVRTTRKSAGLFRSSPRRCRGWTCSSRSTSPPQKQLQRFENNTKERVYKKTGLKYSIQEAQQH